jgi:mannose-6-phosphate isomerase-like protein (cupin superfamily)
VGAKATVGTASRADAVAAFAAEGCSTPRSWANGPGDRFGVHDHAFHKVLFCLAGSIVFHVDGDDVELTAGDRLDLEPGTPHAATVGPEGCECIEASR